jgi:hypothetical protein
VRLWDDDAFPTCVVCALAVPADLADVVVQVQKTLYALQHPKPHTHSACHRGEKSRHKVRGGEN